MNRLAIALAFGSMAIALAIGCSSSVSDPDSETHWLRKCSVDSDCAKGLSCLCNTCTRPCGTSDCKSLGAGTSCVTPTDDALVDGCQLSPGIALCSKACSSDADCGAAGTDLHCLGGACLAGSPNDGAGRATTPSTWVADLTDTYCTWALRCGMFPDGATCHFYEAGLGGFLSVGFNTASEAVAAVSKGTVEFDGAAATACLSALSQTDCSLNLWARLAPAQCAAAFSPGHVSDGGTCTNDV